MPVTLPLYAAGGVYETFQTTVGIGTPPQYFNLTLVSTALNDFVLSSNLTRDDGPCSMPLLDRNEYFRQNLSSTFKSLPAGGPEWNPFWETSTCGPFALDGGFFSDDVKIGQIYLPSLYVKMMLVDYVSGTFVDGWREAGFLTLQRSGIVYYAAGHSSIGDENGPAVNGAITIGGIDGRQCEGEPSFVGTIDASQMPAVAIESVHFGNAEVAVNKNGQLIVEHSVSQIDQSSLEEIARLTDAVFNESSLLFHVDCWKRTTFPDMVFKMGSFEYVLSAQFYIRKVSQGVCVLMFDGNNTRDYSPSWALGTSFLKPYCLVIDYEHQKVSFANIPGMTYRDSSLTTPTTPATSGPLSTLAIVAIAASSIMIACVTTGLTVFCKYRRRSNRRKDVAPLPSTKYYFVNRFMRRTSVDPGYDEYELSATDIRISDVLLGEGAYGVVYKGTLNASRCLSSGSEATSAMVTDEVAVKMLHSHITDQARHVQITMRSLSEQSDSREDFRREIRILKEVSGHPHILNIVGCVTAGHDPVLVTELCASGDLLVTVRRHKACTVSDSDLCKLEDGVCAIRRRLTSFAWQICDGMVFLASKKLVHRDLAARNVLVTFQMVAKIADFGMCLHKGSDTSAETRKVAVRWSAPEALRPGAFSQASDVWSYGVLLYELFSGGEMPYAGVDVEKLIDFLEEGGRLERPQTCPDGINGIMSRCWSQAPDERPSFDDIRSSLAVILEQRSYLYGYIDASEHYWSRMPKRDIS